MRAPPTEPSILEGAGVVPILRCASAAECRRRAFDCVAAGYRLVEIALTTPGALDVIAELADRGVTVGAGTVLDLRALRDAQRAGAQFAVSPVGGTGLIGHGAGIEVVLGAATPSEVHAAMCAGSRAVKIFPARQLGGPAYIRALMGPFPDVRPFPTGGITRSDVDAYLEAGAIAVGVGHALDTAGGESPPPSEPPGKPPTT